MQVLCQFLKEHRLSAKSTAHNSNQAKTARSSANHSIASTCSADKTSTRRSSPQGTEAFRQDTKVCSPEQRIPPHPKELLGYRFRLHRPPPCAQLQMRSAFLWHCAPRSLGLLLAKLRLGNVAQLSGVLPGTEEFIPPPLGRQEARLEELLLYKG